MTNYKKIIRSTLLIIFIFFVFSPVYAQDATAPDAFDKARGKLNIIGGITGFGTTAETGDVGIYNKIASIINILLSFAGILALIFIIYAGVKWITAQGNEEQVKGAKSTIRDAIIGIIVIFTAYVIVNFVVTKLIVIFTGS